MSKTLVLTVYTDSGSETARRYGMRDARAMGFKVATVRSVPLAPIDNRMDDHYMVSRYAVEMTGEWTR